MTATVRTSSTDAVPLSPSVLYRPDIDGLRAFSILSVVIFHCFPRHVLPGGFIGVDIFFVISGFLISGIILKSQSAGAFSYAHFYGRRVKRIFPALIVVLAASMLAGWLFLFPFEWKSMEKHVFAGAAFMSNIALMREQAGYFNNSPNPLLHLWSLGIEEQFYIAWPLLLALVWKRRLTLQLILLVLSLSFALNLWYIEQDPSAVFYFPATRFWELALGAFLAHLMLFQSEFHLRWIPIHEPRTRSVISIAGLVLLVASLVFIDENRAFPGAWALLPTTGAFLTIAAGPEGWFNRVVLSSRPMVFFGLISYPLYLWHWPVIFFAKALSPTGMPWAISGTAVLASITLSYATYRVVEIPLRHHRSTVAVPCLLAVVVGAIGLSGLFGYYRVQPRIHSALTDQVAAAITDWDYPFDFNFKRNSQFQAGEVRGRRAEQVLFIGDSHAEQYYPRVKTLTDSDSANFPTSVFLTSGGCPPLPNISRPGYACDKFFDYATMRARSPEVKTVVFSAWWEGYFNNPEVTLHRTGDHSRGTATQLADFELNALGSALRSLTTSGKRVFIILSNPVSRLYDPKTLISRITGREERDRPDSKTLETGRPILDKLKAISLQSGATVIDPAPYFCSGSACKTTDERGLPMYMDDNHLRSSYASCCATWVDQVYGRAQ